MFYYKRLLHYYETDAMGIIHHSNFIRILEESRVAWLRQFSKKGDRDLLGDINYPVLHCEVSFNNPLHFDDEVTVGVAVTTRGARLTFDYILTTKRFDKPVAFGKTVHAAFDMKNRRVVKIPEAVIDFLAQGN